MIRLLEATARAERDHFWFRGFRRFVEPLVADAGRRRVRSTFSIAVAAPATTSRGCGATVARYGIDLDVGRTAVRAPARASASRPARRRRSCRSPSERLRPGHVVRRASTRSTTRPSDRRSPKWPRAQARRDGSSSTSQRSTCSEEITLFFRAKCAVTAGGTCAGASKRRDLSSGE